ncbi:Ensconsin (Microtubule-associated protein 7) [Schistosoma japonicum]|nr:Ensconsin (Microtubule-associated protein 7) [Schistosoma japonicum]KAH8863124.1 Ensconsin (Microtubule-associated protein 7) [Schistosoma japonicum]
MELNGVQNQPTDDEQVPNGSLTTGSGSAHQDPDLTRPSSADSSQLHRAPSNQSSNASLSIEERLRRVRAAEKLKQQQRYAAYIEAQQQAEMARMRQQEERRRKIEEMRQKEQTRRLSALERRAALELSNQARIERLRERSANRSGNNTFRRRFTEHDHSGRTASASPSLGMSRNPSSLMTTSCVVAFGSSAPRSICTQPSAAALRLKQAFEARLASYLTGRHSGCFFTAAATPYYSCFIDPSHGPRPPTSVYKSRPSSRGVTQSRRAVSAHAYVLRQTKSSCTRVTHARRQQNSLTNKYTTFKSGRSLISKDSKSPNTATVPDGHNFESNQTSEVISSRSNSSNECDKIGRFNHHGKVVTKHSTVAANCSKIKEDTGNIRESKRTGSSTMPPMMSKSVSGDALHQRHQKKPVLPSKPLSPTSYPTKIQEPETAISSHPQVPQSLSASESEINAKVAEVASTVTMPCNYSPTSPLSQVDTVKEETGVITTQLGPIKAETHGSGEGAVLKENEAAIYRAKLIEQRRLAKERMEEEQRRLEEENRIRRMQQEQARLAAEEETRLKVEQAAREAAEARLKEEQAAREAEEAQRAKEAEEVARAQAEEAERLEKLKRIEEERVLRKKKLDSIMSRVKRPVSTAKLGSEVVSESESAPNLQSTDITQLSSVPDTTCVSPDKVSHPEPSLDVQVPEIETKSSDTHTILNGRVTFTIDGEQENESSSSLEESVSQSPLSKTLIQKDLQNTVNNTFEDHVSSTTINGEEVKVTDLHSNQVDTDTETSLRISTTQSMSNSHSSVLKNNSSASHSTPLFKSALLQSMLGAGRLSTHAKDAVAGLRRNSSHVQDDQNKSDTWSQNTCHGDSPVSSFYSVNSTVIQDGDSVNINNSSSSK